MAMINRYALTVLANAAWQIVAIYLIGCIAAWLLRKSPRRQHIVWLLASLLCILLPLISLYPARVVRHRGETLSLIASLRPAHHDAPLSPDTPWGKLTLAIYGISVCWTVGRSLFAWRSTRHIIQSAGERELPAVFEKTLAKCLARFPTPEVRILCTKTWPGPLTIGFRNQAIILPESIFESGSEEILLTVIGHELAHIRRRDFLWNSIVESFYPLLAFHPCAALIRRRMRDTRELACDAMVAGKLIDASTYASSLLEVALQSSTVPQSPPVLAAVGSGNLEERIRRLVLSHSDKVKYPVLITLACITLLVSLFSVSLTYSLQTSNPNDFTGVWQENWGRQLRKGIQYDSKLCCYRILDIRYEKGSFSGFISEDYIDINDDRVTSSNRVTVPIQNLSLENGVLRFHHGDWTYELTPREKGEAFVRADLSPKIPVNWALFTKVQ